MNAAPAVAVTPLHDWRSLTWAVRHHQAAAHAARAEAEFHDAEALRLAALARAYRPTEDRPKHRWRKAAKQEFAA